MKSFPIKDSAQIRVVREHFPDICLCSRESGSSFQIHSAYVCLKDSRASANNCHRALDRNNFNLQPFSRFASLLDFARILLPVRHIFSCSKVRRNKLHTFSKILADVISLLYFKMSLHSQFLDFFIEKILLGWRGCQLLWIHGSWVHGDLLVFVPWPIPWASYHLRSRVYFSPLLLCINWAGVIWSRFLEAVSTSVKRNFLNHRTPVSARFGHGVCGPVGSLFTLCIRWNACMSW